MAPVIVFVLQQMHKNKGIKNWKKGEEDRFKEMKQQHEREAILPIKIDKLDEKERDEIINSLLLVEENRDGSLKGRLVAHGDQQKQYLNKDEVYSPTVKTTSVFLTSVIEAKEKHDTRVHDIPNAFVQTENEDKVVLKVKEKSAELLVKTDPKLYRKYVIYEQGIVILYVELKKHCVDS